MLLQRQLRNQEGLKTIHIAPMVNVLLLLLLFYILVSALTSPSTIDVKLPKTITSNIIQEQTTVITINSEDLIYLNDQIINIKDLEKTLKTPAKDKSILIKADRRASVGRIVELWDLCQKLGIERINIATN